MSDNRLVYRLSILVLLLALSACGEAVRAPSATSLPSLSAAVPSTQRPLPATQPPLSTATPTSPAVYPYRHTVARNRAHATTHCYHSAVAGPA